MLKNKNLVVREEEIQATAQEFGIDISDNPRRQAAQLDMTGDAVWAILKAAMEEAMSGEREAAVWAVAYRYNISYASLLTGVMSNYERALLLSNRMKAQAEGGAQAKMPVRQAVGA